MKKSLIVLFISLIGLVFSANEATIKTYTTYQTIRGFGGINHPEWIGDLTATQRAKVFQNGSNDLGFTILRVFVNDDSSSWIRSVETAKYAQSQGALIFASPWNPPSTMTETFTSNGITGKRLRHDKYNEYAQHLNNYVQFMKNNGVNIYAISIQNEPDYGHDWTWWTKEECVQFLAYYSSVIDCKVMSPETFQYNKQYYNAILSDYNANKNVDLFGTHFYGTLRSQMDFPALENDSRDIWMTEVYVPNSSSDADTWPEAIDVAINMHNGLVIGSMSAYVWWYIRRSYGPMKENGQISKRGYMMAHFSKFIRPGAIRIDATESPTNDVYISAFKNKDGSIIIVAINNGNQSYAQFFNISGITIKNVNRYRTSASENLAFTKNLALSGNGFWAQLNVQTVSTFIIN